MQQTWHHTVIVKWIHVYLKKMPNENYLTCNYYNAYRRKRCSNILSKSTIVKSFRTVATQTDNNIAINILNSKKVHPEDMNILDHMEDLN